MDLLLQEQQNLAEKINNLHTNYKKDGSDRKTIKYLELKIQTLKGFYNQYSANHEKIETYSAPLDISHGYFIERRITTDTFNTFIADMRQRLNIAPTTPTIPKGSQLAPSFSLPDHTQATHEISTHSNNDYQRMLKQQDIRIRSLYREIGAATELLDTNTSKAALTLKLKNMDRLMMQIMHLHEEISIESSAEDENTSAYFVDNHYENIKTNYEDIVIALTIKIDEYHGTVKPMEIRLQPIEIPHFDGDYMKWMGFEDTFKRLVHENNQLTKTHKMNYLKSHIRGPAEKLLSHLQPSGENYDAAWQILQSRFNNRRMLVSILLNNLFNQPNINTESASALKSLHDTTTEMLYAIRNTGINIETWNPIIIFTISKKLDNESKRLYESSLENPKEFQSTTQFLNFLERRFQSLESTGNNRSAQVQQPKFQPFKRAFTTTTSQKHPTIICVCCQKNHRITVCQRFLELSLTEKNQMVMLHNLCRNCLSHNHETLHCNTHTRCSICKGAHHTLLHQKQHQGSSTSYINLNVKSTQINDPEPVLLATALVKVRNIYGGFDLLRALIDPGSQATFVTQQAAQQLGLPKIRVLAEVSGISSSKRNSHEQITIEISPRFPSKFNVETQALVLKTITKPLPDNKRIGLDIEIQNGGILADPTFDTPGPIDLLIGADTYGEIILEGVKKDPRHKYIAQKTEIGWIISGRLRNNTQIARLNSLVTLTDIDNQLKRFWISEELHPKRNLTIEEINCERHYEKTHRRLENGRYEVRIPFNTQFPDSELGESKKRAAARLIHMERRFNKDEDFKNSYHEFMNEYIKLGHMEPVSNDNTFHTQKGYYIPHHSVLKEDSTTTKLRVVFDASCKTTSNVSLNQMMLIGPTIQDDLVTILIRWRKHRYAFTADIEKMFRQIMIAEEDSNFQLILWRASQTQRMQTYKLKTITYGTASATYLATKTLQQLAVDDTTIHPIGAQLALKDFYVDDLLTGANTLEEAIIAQHQLSSLLTRGGFNLRKWNSNDKAILQHLPETNKETGLHAIQFDDTVKTLGLYWNSSADTFQIKVKMPESEVTTTKRNILSEATKIFDPLGWMAPVVIRAKLILQDLWASGIDWDTKVQPHIEEKWLSYKQELPNLEKIKIDRWINYTTNCDIEIHGFCDASSQAYAAIVYTKAKGVIRIIAAKTKVAPLNQTISLPRLELNAAVLLSRLLLKVRTAFDLSESQTYCWTDSTAALGWIKGKPQNYKTFVANRITEVQAITNPSQWHYVASNENPADCASRGINPNQLLAHNLWWHGPTWLKLTTYPIINKNKQEPELAESSERKTIQVFVSTTKDHTIDFNRFSSLKRLIRSIAYCYRFMSNLKNKNNKNTSHLQPDELKAALKSIIKIMQLIEFEPELHKLNNNQPLSKNSTILTLNPFIDSEGLLRVGGRLHNSNLTFDEKHPLILPRSHQLSKLIIREAHTQTLHGGNQATLAHIRQNYWILHAKNSIRHIIHNCTKCARFKKQTHQQLMGILPPERVLPAFPFTNSGVDYAGPINLKLYKGRCNKTCKAYIAIFICMATKAVHLELVSDLTTEAFLAAFKRFTSRRGSCLKMFSDCGTNFVGASKQLKIKAQQQQKETATKLAELGTSWHFIPPGSPHFGGLWEAGVKSTKHHLHKILGGNILTFEEFSTLLTQIEACLNSRPLAALSNDIDDDTVLTPGHFLIGRAIIATPEPDMTNLKVMTRWNLLTKITQQFWKKWSSEYLSRLQRRPKWLNEQPNIKEGELVLIKDEQLPPTRWPLARVVQLHHGADELVRVVTLKQNNNILKRNITKLCRLPSTDDIRDSTSQTSPSTRETRSNSKASRTTTTNRVMSILTILLVIGSSNANSNNDFQVTFWNNSPGIYFEEIGTINMLASRWKIVIHYDLNSYFKEITNIMRYMNTLRESCSHLQYEEDRRSICMTIYQQLNRQVTTINQQNTLIQKFNKHTDRFKRGLGDSLGLVLGDLFGVLTQREAEHYEHAIVQTRSNEDYLMNLLKNQTSIIDATINVVKHDHDISSKHFNILDENIRKLGNNTDHLATDNLRHNKIQSVLIFTLQILLATKDLQDTQNAIIDVLTHSQHGKIHPSLLTPQQLVEELRRISENIPSDSRLPGSNKMNNLAEIYRIMSVKYRITNNKIVFLVQLPLVHVETFQLYNQLAVPVVSKNMSQYIKPFTKYLAVNGRRERHAPISQQDFNECIIVKEDLYICDISPIYNKQSSISACELNFLQHSTSMHPSCDLQTSEAANTWIKTWESNKWIFSLIEETNFDLLCDQTSKMIPLKGAGIFNFLSDCVLRGNSFVISAVTYNANEVKTSYLPTSNLTFTRNEVNVTKLKENIKEQQEKNSALADLKTRIQSLQENEHLPADMNHHDVHHYTVSYTTLGILIIIIAVVWFQCKRQPQALGSVSRLNTITAV